MMPQLILATALALQLLTPLSGDDPDPSPSIPSRGGQLFPHRVELPVVDFAQDDPRWGRERLGPSSDTLADQGCTVTSVAMVLNYLHVRCDPSILNRYLFRHGGYDDEGLLDFERVVDFAPNQVGLGYQGDPSYELIDRNLRTGNPVIVQLMLPGGYRHFVVVVGKEGFDYLVRDPAADPVDSLVTLKSLSPRIEQIYIYTARGR